MPPATASPTSMTSRTSPLSPRRSAAMLSGAGGSLHHRITEGSERICRRMAMSPVTPGRRVTRSPTRSGTGSGSWPTARWWQIHRRGRRRTPYLLTTSPRRAPPNRGLLSGSLTWPQQTGDGLVAEVEDALEVTTNHEVVGNDAEGSERQRVVDAVSRERALRVWEDLVEVLPQSIRPPQLAVDEAASRLPHRDARDPAQRDSGQAQAILDERPHAHVDQIG